MRARTVYFSPTSSSVLLGEAQQVDSEGLVAMERAVVGANDFLHLLPLCGVLCGFGSGHKVVVLKKDRL